MFTSGWGWIQKCSNGEMEKKIQKKTWMLNKLRKCIASWFCVPNILGLVFNSESNNANFEKKSLIKLIVKFNILF
jgi:hypothetical protein